MNNELLQALCNCYRSSSALVLIMDLHWNVLWSNKEPVTIGSLPTLLGISPNQTEHATHHFQLDGLPYTCRLLCNMQDGLRIAEIFPDEQPLRLDPAEVTTAIQSISNACFVLNQTFDREQLQDQRWMLNTIMGSCYRVYRSVYLHNLTEQMRSDTQLPVTFCVQSVLRQSYAQLVRILERCMDVEMDCTTVNLYANGNPDALVSALLAAVVLCCADSTCFLSLRISLAQQDGAVLTVSAEDTPLPLEDVQRITDISANGAQAERMILHQFCTAHGGSWMLHTDSAQGIRSCILRFPASEEHEGSIHLESTKESTVPEYFGKHSVMLSCLHYREMF